MGRWLARLAVVGLVALWGFVLFLAIVRGREDSPDRLEDRAFPEQAQAACDAREDLIAALPPAADAADAAERSATLVTANGHLADMLDDLDDLVPLVPAGEDREIVLEWLADWRVYLRDRESYADELRADPEARLLVSPKGSKQITEYLDQFAKDNDMPACSTPADA